MSYGVCGLLHRNMCSFALLSALVPWCELILKRLNALSHTKALSHQEKANVVFIGTTGIGNHPLATALALDACGFIAPLQGLNHVVHHTQGVAALCHGLYSCRAFIAQNH